MAKKRVGIIGSTGSVGRQAVEVILANKDLFDVVFLTCHSNRNLLFKQIEQLKAGYGVITSESDSTLTDILDGEQIDVILHAAGGIGGVKPAYEVVSRGIDIALANKESIVTAGAIITETAEESCSKIIPVDSEHSAIFQCLMGQRKKNLASVTLTASGGPFRKRPKDAMESVSVEEALSHPNWSMGRKITVDSATMMNKGLELIEAKYLFDLPADMLNVVIHPESIIHSYVSFCDGSVIAQMGQPDMKVPISFALGFPERIESTVKPLDLGSLGRLTFEKPDLKRFPCLNIAIKVLESGSNALMTAMNAANEAAVAAFLNKEISFSAIARTVEETLSKITFNNASTIDEACLNSSLAYETALSVIANSKKKM